MAAEPRRWDGHTRLQQIRQRQGWLPEKTRLTLREAARVPSRSIDSFPRRPAKAAPDVLSWAPSSASTSAHDPLQNVCCHHGAPLRCRHHQRWRARRHRTGRAAAHRRQGTRQRPGLRGRSSRRRGRDPRRRQRSRALGLAHGANEGGRTRRREPAVRRNAVPRSLPRHLSPDRCLLLHGSKDTLVLPSHSESILAAFHKAAVPTNLITFPEAAHGFTGADEQTASTAMVAWFEKHLALPSAP